MAFKAYSVGCKKNNVPVVSDIKVVRRLLPNGNIVTIICGKTKKCGVVCTIVSNQKPKKECKTGLKRGKTGRCSSNF